MLEAKPGKGDFIFLVGCARSGTQLLSRLLEEKFDVCLPLETHFIPIFNRFIYLWGDLKKYPNRKRLLDNIYGFLDIFIHAWDSYNVDHEKLKSFTLLATREREERILEQSGSYAELVCNMFREYASIHGQARYGDKSAFFQHFPLEKLDGRFDNLKVIHIVRDGRDVALSWMKQWFGPVCFAEAARQWSAHVMKNTEWGRGNPDRYLVVKYEDLIAAPDEILERISKYLNAPIQSGGGTTSSAFSEELSKLTSHKLLSGPIDKSNFDKWKKGMPPSERMMFDFFAGDALREYGYEVMDIPAGRKFILMVKFAAVFPFYTLSIRNIKRKLKSLLPPILFFSYFSGLSPASAFDKIKGRKRRLL